MDSSYCGDATSPKAISRSVANAHPEGSWWAFLSGMRPSRASASGVAGFLFRNPPTGAILHPMRVYHEEGIMADGREIRFTVTGMT